MAIAQENTRIMFTVSKELKEKLEKQAAAEHRNLSEFIRHALLEYLKSL